jgi:hypothetical protein
MALSSASSVIEGFLGSIGPLAVDSDFGETIADEGAASFAACPLAWLANNIEQMAITAPGSTQLILDRSFTRLLDANQDFQVVRIPQHSRMLRQTNRLFEHQKFVWKFASRPPRG